MYVNLQKMGKVKYLDYGKFFKTLHIDSIGEFL